MRIAIAGEAPFELAPIRRAIRRAVRPYRLPADAEVQVAFVSADEMRALNKRFRRIDKTTDVLSFGEAIPPRDPGAGALAHRGTARAGGGGRFDWGGAVIGPELAERHAGRRKSPGEGGAGS